MENSNYLKSFLLIYLVSLSGFTSSLINSKLKNKISESRFAQHIVGITTVLVLVNLLGVDKLDTLIPATIFIYIGFLLTTKLSLSINMIVLLLFLVSYITEIKFSRKIKDIRNDIYVNENIIRKIINSQNKIRYLITAVIGIIVVYGCVNNYNKKETELEGGFNPVRFFMDGKDQNMYGGSYVNYKI